MRSLEESDFVLSSRCFLRAASLLRFASISARRRSARDEEEDIAVVNVVSSLTGRVGYCIPWNYLQSFSNDCSRLRPALVKAKEC